MPTSWNFSLIFCKFVWNVKTSKIRSINWNFCEKIYMFRLFLRRKFFQALQWGGFPFFGSETLLSLCPCPQKFAQTTHWHGGDSPPNKPKSPPNRKMEKEKGEKFAKASGTLENRRKMVKNHFPLRFSNEKVKKFSQKFHILMVFSQNAQYCIARFLNLLEIY